jgi:hypothetical protein
LGNLPINSEKEKVMIKALKFLATLVHRNHDVVTSHGSFSFRSEGDCEEEAVQNCFDRIGRHVRRNARRYPQVEIHNEGRKIVAKLTSQCLLGGVGTTTQEAVENYLSDVRQLLEYPRDVFHAQLEIVQCDGYYDCEYDHRIFRGEDEDLEKSIAKCIDQVKDETTIKVEVVIPGDIVVSKKSYEEMPREIPANMGLVILQGVIYDHGLEIVASTRYFAMNIGNYELQTSGYDGDCTEVESGHTPSLYRVVYDYREDKAVSFPDGVFEYVEGRWMPCQLADFNSRSFSQRW